jgi:hypothetical protein
VIAVAEGAGQELLAVSGTERDASGNVKLQDIGPFLRDRIETYFKAEGIPATLRYFDPSYLIRSVPADAEDSILCDFFARNAVHAAMAGKNRPGDRPAARYFHPRAHRVARQPEEAPGPGRSRLARRAGRDRPEGGCGSRRGMSGNENPHQSVGGARQGLWRARIGADHRRGYKRLDGAAIRRFGGG